MPHAVAVFPIATGTGSRALIRKIAAVSPMTRASRRPAANPTTPAAAAIFAAAARDLNGELEPKRKGSAFSVNTMPVLPAGCSNRSPQTLERPSPQAAFVLGLEHPLTCGIGSRIRSRVQWRIVPLAASTGLPTGFPTRALRPFGSRCGPAAEA